MIILTLASCRVVNAHSTGKIARIGIIAHGNSPQLEALRQGLRDNGYKRIVELASKYRLPAIYFGTEFAHLVLRSRATCWHGLTR